MTTLILSWGAGFTLGAFFGLTGLPGPIVPSIGGALTIAFMTLGWLTAQWWLR